MKPRDIFRVIVATAGLIGVCYGAVDLIDGMLFTVGLYHLQHSAPQYYGARGVIQIILGLLVMKGIPPLADFAFPPDEQRPPSSGTSDEDTKQDS